MFTRKSLRIKKVSVDMSAVNEAGDRMRDGDRASTAELAAANERLSDLLSEYGGARFEQAPSLELWQQCLLAGSLSIERIEASGRVTVRASSAPTAVWIRRDWHAGLQYLVSLAVGRPVEVHLEVARTYVGEADGNPAPEWPDVTALKNPPLEWVSAEDALFESLQKIRARGESIDADRILALYNAELGLLQQVLVDSRRRRHPHLLEEVEERFRVPPRRKVDRQVVLETVARLPAIPDGVRLGRIRVKPPGTSASGPAIVEEVAQWTGIPAEQIVGASRARAVSQARGVCAHLLRRVSAFSYERIGEILGNRDHSSILGQIKATRMRLAENGGLRAGTATLASLCDQRGLRDWAERVARFRQ